MVILLYESVMYIRWRLYLEKFYWCKYKIS